MSFTWVHFLKGYLKFLYQIVPIFYTEGSLLGQVLSFSEKILLKSDVNDF